MTEHNERILERYTYTPAGSLWMEGPTFWRDTSAMEWERAAEALHSLMPLAEEISEGMVIAMGDALRRARAELERAREREGSEKNEHGLSPEEDRRLLHLMRRCDEVSNAVTMIEDHVPESSFARASTLEALEELHEELHNEYRHYRGELALK